jgi:hypothetical protein
MPYDAKKPRSGGAFYANSERSANLGDVRCLRSFLTLNDFEFYLVAFGERLETAAADRAEVNEDVRSALSRDEAESFGVVEPFDRACNACH